MPCLLHIPQDLLDKVVEVDGLLERLVRGRLALEDLLDLSINLKYTLCKIDQVCNGQRELNTLAASAGLRNIS